jgi:hypothetical protein
MRSLGREAVNLKRRQQADGSMRDARRDLDEAMVLGDLCVREAVEAPTGVLEDPLSTSRAR